MSALWRLVALSLILRASGQPAPPAAFACLVQDAACATLGDLYYSTGGAGSWLNTTGWADAAAGTATDVCSLFGVDCTDSRVIKWDDYSFATTSSITSPLGGGGLVTSLCVLALAAFCSDGVARPSQHLGRC